MFNSIVLQVGIFPYLSLAFSLFFFEPKTIRNLFLRKKPLYTDNEVIVSKHKKLLITSFSIYFIIQLLLPLRHHFIKDDVLWNEEGHRLSWRMMLRSKQGVARFKVMNKDTKKITHIKLEDYVSSKQQGIVSTKPDVIWQFAQRLKKEYQAKGEDVAVYVDCKISVNGRPYTRLIDPKVDLANVPWDIFKHSDWVLPSSLYNKTSKAK